MAVIVGTLVVSLRMDWCTSLKEKRHVIRSIIEQARNKFNVSSAEVGLQDEHTRSEIAFAIVSNDKSFANSVLDKVLQRVEMNAECEVLESELDFS